jgi:hypothetical protein
MQQIAIIVKVTHEANEVAVQAFIVNDPHTSTRQISQGSGISPSVIQILHSHKCHPYHLSLHQELHGNDFSARVEFCEFEINQLQNSNDFFRNALFTDEASFTNNGQVSFRKMHYWSVENPHWLRQVSQSSVAMESECLVRRR